MTPFSLAPRTARARRLTGLVAAPLATVALLAALPAASTGAGTDPAATAVKQLSNENTLSRWAYPATTGVIYAGPSGKARRLGKLHLLTEDKLPELYLLLRQQTDSHGNTWVQIRLPKRPAGQTGWVRDYALGEFHAIRTLLVVNRHSLRATLYKDGRVIFSAPVGVGKPGTITPSGHFWVREHFRVRGTPVYGPLAIGTSAYSPHLTDWPNGGVVGLHGTDQPQLVPGRPSHGCIRLHNSDITRLYHLLPLGTPLHII
jgi:hypothetical protein